MILETIEDYHKNKLSIPLCEETIVLDQTITKYTKLKKRVYNRKNELEMEDTLTSIKYQMAKVKDLLIKRKLWG